MSAFGHIGKGTSPSFHLQLRRRIEWSLIRWKSFCAFDVGNDAVIFLELIKSTLSRFLIFRRVELIRLVVFPLI